MALAPDRTLSLVTLAAAGALACSLALSDRLPSARFIPSEHPAAVLAWAQTRCSPDLALRQRTARAHAEDVMTVAAAYEADLRYRPLAAVCADALRVAAGAAAHDKTTGVAEAARRVIAAR